MNPALRESRGICLRIHHVGGSCLALLAAAITAPGAGEAATTSRAPNAGPRPTGDGPATFFTREVRPLLEQHCFSCRSGANPTGGLDLTRRDAILKGGARGPVVSEDVFHVKHLRTTILYLMGLDPNRLTDFFGGLDQKLVGVEGAEPIRGIL